MQVTCPTAGRKSTLSSHVKLDITANTEEGFSAIGLGARGSEGSSPAMGRQRELMHRVRASSLKPPLV